MLATSPRTAPVAPQEGIDHLFLLPKRVLDMDNISLRKDLAGLDFDYQIFQNGPQGNVWLSGDSVQLHKSTPPAPSTDNNNIPKPGNVNNQLTRDREERLRLLKEKQNEERQRKLEELKQQALVAQKFREQKEEERRRRIEELRLRDLDRRQQVEERKRQIWEVERDRRQAIVRKNLDREARIEAKKRHDRSSIMFAFGSSTPRMLEPADTGGTYWASRRATSTTNVMTMSLCTPPPPGPLTRRSSERELNDGGKKRATSAGGLLDGDDYISGTAQPFRTANRRKTDLMPTIPFSSRTPGSSKSGESTPSSRPPSQCSSVTTRPQAAPRRPRPASIAITGVSNSPSLDLRNSLSSEFRNSKPTEKPPLPKVHVTKKPMQPKQSLDSTTKKTSAKSSKQSSVCSTPALHSPVSDAGTLHDEITSNDNKENVKFKESSLQLPLGGEAKVEEKLVVFEKKVEEVVKVDVEDSVKATKDEINEATKDSDECNSEEITQAITVAQPVAVTQPAPVTQSSAPSAVAGEESEENVDMMSSSMTSSMIAKTRIETEEEAKAILAERRRLAREQAEREAEAERQAVEAARLAELEEQRKLEEESLRLIEEARQAEEARLRVAIEETQAREEEERKRKEEELRQKLEKEELERKAKEEAEKQRIEMEIRLKKEEEDRQARRKRVEAIMLRTRGKGSTPTNTNKDDGDLNISEEQHDSSSNVSNNFSDDLSKENESNGFNHHSNGHHNGFSDKNNEQNVVSNAILDISNTHGDKSSVDLLNLGIPTIIPTETNNVNNFNNSQVTDLLS